MPHAPGDYEHEDEHEQEANKEFVGCYQANPA